MHILAQINSFQVSLANITHMEKSFRKGKRLLSPCLSSLSWIEAPMFSIMKVFITE